MALAAAKNDLWVALGDTAGRAKLTQFDATGVSPLSTKLLELAYL